MPFHRKTAHHDVGRVLWLGDAGSVNHEICARKSGWGAFGASGVTVNRVARWDGSAWAALAGPVSAGVNDVVNVLTVFEGELIAGGYFPQAGGVTTNRIARWGGSAWTPLAGPAGTGMNFGVHALAAFEGELFVGGEFTQAGGVAASRLAPYTRQPTVSEELVLDPEKALSGQPVLVVARVQGVATAPDGGLGFVLADSGESCETRVFIPVSGPGIDFACELIPIAPGQRELTAGYSGSAAHLPSEAAPIHIEVIGGVIFSNGFEPGE